MPEETVTSPRSPTLAKSIRKSVDFLDQTLIRSDVKQVQCHQWFAANGLEAPTLHGMRFDRSFLAIATAAKSLGRRWNQRSWPSANGRLVAPLTGRANHIRYVGHRLIYPRASRQRFVGGSFCVLSRGATRRRGCPLLAVTSCGVGSNTGGDREGAGPLVRCPSVRTTARQPYWSASGQDLPPRQLIQSGPEVSPRWRRYQLGGWVVLIEFPI